MDFLHRHIDPIAGPNWLYFAWLCFFAMVLAMIIRFVNLGNHAMPNRASRHTNAVQVSKSKAISAEGRLPPRIFDRTTPPFTGRCETPFINGATMELMDDADNPHARRRNGGSGPRRTPRSASNHSTSSTSSDILVAPGPPTSIPSKAAMSEMSAPVVMEKGTVTAEVVDKRLLIVRVTGGKNLAVLQMLADHDALNETNPKEIQSTALSITTDDNSNIKDDINDDGAEGPNHRGTYSKSYVLQHPEIKWQHRGQGRYLPSGRGGRPSHLIRSQSSLSAAGLLKQPRSSLDSYTDQPFHRPTPQRRRGSWAATEQSSKEKLSLPRRTIGAQTKDDDTDDAESASARIGRRAKPAPSTESERRSSRIVTQQSYAEDDEEDSDMAGDKDPTYDKEYVDAHPNDKFYHTGNGWYKKGERPRGRLNAKRRESEGHAVMRKSDGTFEFDAASTIHVTQLGLYPGVDFHHCGNGWYKAGPDPTGHRTSRLGGESSLEDEVEDETDEEDGNPEEDDGVVSKAYTLRHPEISWVHRGNGRFKRSSAVKSTPVSDSYASQEPDRDNTIYSKAWVQAHPNEIFHHRGNARYMKGPPPEQWAANRRRKSQPTITEPEDDGALYSKAYVKDHPNEEFHHRGQGRYARGPRKQTSMEDSANNSDLDEGLVDTDFVDSHPNDTFHHRGQGRWARGLPPFGASNKVAIRGPGARDKSESGIYEYEEDESEQPPAVTALVVKADGPDKFPHLQWHYRGGGKWGRVTKHEYEEIQRGGTRKPRGRARARNADGADAQLERETADADGQFDSNGFMIPEELGMSSQDRPKIKRRRRTKNGIYSTTEDGGILSKQSSKSHSVAPTPKPRMLEAHEDILAEEDLPSLYRGDDRDWSPIGSTGSADDEADNLLRNMYRPINAPEKFVKGLTKHDPAIRPLENLKRLADNAQQALNEIQRQYLMLERISAPHARIPRKPHKGGRVPVEQQIFEDKKEADLYDYNYDARRIGFQDPQAQRIQRDAEGRELRNRRNRSGANSGTLPGWNFGEDEIVGPRRAVKPVNRFDGIVNPPRKRARNSATTTGRNSKAPSMTPDRAGTPLGGPVRNSYLTTSRLTGNVPKRVRELRDDPASMTMSGGLPGAGASGSGGRGATGSVSREASPGGTVRKGRPPGSKNLHKRKDAGIKKGPRKPKVVDSIETGGSEAEGEGEEDDMGDGEVV